VALQQVKSMVLRSFGHRALLGVLVLALSGCPNPESGENGSGANNGGNNGSAVDAGSGGGTNGGNNGTPDGGTNTGTPDAGPAGPTCDVHSPLPARLLTRQEYNLTVADLLYNQTRPADALPEENNVLGFDNNAEYHQATPILVEGFMALAESLSLEAATNNIQYVAPCDVASLGEESCREVFLSYFGRRAFRRPLTDAETQIFRDLFIAVRGTGSYNDAVRLVLQAFLQSPQFLYRIETPADGEDPAARYALSPDALASRLSYFLWGTMPDEVLIQAAIDGELDTRDGVLGQVSRMIADPRARESVRHFHRQWLFLNRLDHVTKDGLEAYPGGMEALGQDLKESMLAFVDAAFWADGDAVSTMLSSPNLFLNSALGPEFGFNAGLNNDFTAVAASPDERAGLLTQPALLSILAHPDQSSPIHRGIFVREKMLCEVLPPPPNDILIEPPDPDPNATTRERFAQHTEEELCQGCHELIDPIGFGFENYDELGRFRTEENGLPIDVSGSLLYTNTPEIEGDFDGAVELSLRLATADQVKACIGTQWYRFAFNKGETVADACRVQKVRDALIQNGSFKEMLTAIASSDGFRFRAGMDIGTVAPLPDDGSTPGVDNGLVPEGALESVSDAGLVTGWALDPDGPSTSITVEFFLDGGDGVGTFLMAAIADVPRSDVNAMDPLWIGNHGFSVQLPQVALDAQDHTLFAVARNTGTGGDTTLLGSPMAFRAGLNANPPAEANPPANNNAPEGFIDNVSPAGRASGWALDRDDLTRDLEVHLYVDGPAFGGGTFAGSTTASNLRQDVNDALGVTGNHGFGMDLPAQFLDGQSHTLYVYGFNAGHPGAVLLSNSPLTFSVP
jgi:hypothetical protein